MQRRKLGQRLSSSLLQISFFNLECDCFIELLPSNPSFFLRKTRRKLVVKAQKQLSRSWQKALRCFRRRICQLLRLECALPSVRSPLLLRSYPPPQQPVAPPMVAWRGSVPCRALSPISPVQRAVVASLVRCLAAVERVPAHPLATRNTAGALLRTHPGSLPM